MAAFGETYPMRYGTPDSQVVPYNPTPQDFATNWQASYNQASQPQTFDYNTPIGPFGMLSNPERAGSWAAGGMSRFFKSPLDTLIEGYSKNTGITDPAELQKVRDFAIAAYKNPNGDPMTAQGLSPTPGQASAFGGIANNRDFANSLFGFDTGSYPGSGKGGAFDPSAPGASYVQQHFDPLKTQTFDDYMKNGSLSNQFWMNANAHHAMSDLTNQKNAMMPTLTAATRAEQGFQQQNGWGQTNGIMSADYSSPGFGQINGDFGQGNLGQNGGAQPSMPLGAMPNTIWGAAPQRVRQWGI